MEVSRTVFMINYDNVCANKHTLHIALYSPHTQYYYCGHFRILELPLLPYYAFLEKVSAHLQTEIP